MNLRVLCPLLFGLAVAAACAQQANPAGQDSQSPETSQGMRGGMGGGMGLIGRGVFGTVTEAAADHFTIKTFQGESYTIHFSANTRLRKAPAGQRGMGEGRGQWRRGEGGGNPPQEIKASDIKVGDTIGAMGEIDTSARSVGAVGIVLLNPEQAKQIQQMESDYGKTWLMGRVTAIDGVKVTLAGGGLDNTPHTFVADENTTFRKRRDPITLADIKVGDVLRVGGSVKDGVFTAASVEDAGEPGQGGGRRSGPPPQ